MSGMWNQKRGAAAGRTKHDPSTISIDQKRSSAPPDPEDPPRQQAGRTGELPKQINDQQSLRDAQAAVDPTLTTKIQALNSYGGKAKYFLTNCYVFFLAICKDLDFMSWTIVIKRGLATGDQAVFMMVVYSIVGFCVGFIYFMYRASSNQQKIKKTGKKYEQAMKSSLQISSGLFRGSAEQRREKKKKNEYDVLDYMINYGKPGDGEVFTVVRYWHCIPMLGVLSFIIFYTRENHDGRVARLLRASSLRTLILINSWSTIAITIPCVFVIVYVFLYGGVSWAEADMFTKFSAIQAGLSIFLTFSAYGMPGFEDNVVSILKNADELSYERVKSKMVCKMLYTYWSNWHLDLADLLMCFQIADIGKKKSVQIGNNNRKTNLLINFPTEDNWINHDVWKERFDVVWKEGLVTKCKKLVDKYAQLKEYIYQEGEISEKCVAIVNAYTDGEEEEFWKNCKALYAKICAFSVEAAREVVNAKTVLGLPKDSAEDDFDEKNKEYEQDCRYRTPLYTVKPDRTYDIDLYYGDPNYFPSRA